MEPRRLSKTPRSGPSLWLRAGQDQGGGQGLREKRLHLRYPLESGKHLYSLGREDWKPHSVLLGFGGVIFPLAGIPQQQGDADGRESHDPEGCPVQLWKTKALLRSLD